MIAKLRICFFEEASFRDEDDTIGELAPVLLALWSSLGCERDGSSYWERLEEALHSLGGGGGQRTSFRGMVTRLASPHCAATVARQGVAPMCVQELTACGASVRFGGLHAGLTGLQ